MLRTVFSAWSRSLSEIVPWVRAMTRMFGIGLQRNLRSSLERRRMHPGITLWILYGLIDSALN
ncbi:hypothetical protein Mpal_1528 [Methanosphaerula palustris E1-9c]|uniref:Uncharacterized protein n=1 Tax=Methanosphaerula palustris (strain ATCC BAA-1556 / DSM 19958 / E1-9c) TaxID=521011 RepID=B8GIM9_METPE|nr:hypothetical protein Mpal_1528 [Methanosphaerula palustris E1-9c]